MSGSVAELADHPNRAFKVQTTVLIASRPDAEVRLRAGEELFVARRHKPIMRPGYVGPDNVMVLGNEIAKGNWPVVLCVVRSVHAGQWCGLSGAVATRMVNRANAKLQELGIDALTPHQERQDEE